MGLRHFQDFNDEASQEKRLVKLKSRDALVDATARYVDNMARGGVALKYISSDGAGELGKIDGVLEDAVTEGNRMAHCRTEVSTE